LPKQQAAVVAERIQQNYGALALSPTSLSVGAAEFVKSTGDIEADVEDMIRRADAALYHVKHHLGGNEVSFDPGPTD
jgi:GGDEF domain-containing protein